MFLFITHFGFHWTNLSGQPQPPSLGITNPTYLHTNMPNYLFTSHPSLSYQLLPFPPFFPLFAQAHKRCLWREFKLIEKYKELCSSHLLPFSPFFPPFFLFYTSCWCKGLSFLWQPLWLLYSFFYYHMEFFYYRWRLES